MMSLLRHNDVAVSITSYDIMNHYCFPDYQDLMKYFLFQDLKMDNGELDEDVCPICKASLEDAKDTAK